MLIFNKTCIGHSHINACTHCQDFSGSYSDDNRAIISVCDGHGSTVHFRSELGSRYAVKSIIETFKDLDIDLISDTKDFKYQLKIKLVSYWNSLVENDLAKHPIIFDYDLNGFTEKDINRLRNNPIIAYGSTMLGVLMTNKHVIVVQLGDGLAIKFNKNEFIEVFDDEENELVGNVTYSLCQNDLDKLIQIKIFDSSLVDGILICTDGVINPYNFLDRFKENCFDKYVKDAINTKKLQNLSDFIIRLGTDANFSPLGDDVSLAFVVKEEIETKKSNETKIDDESSKESLTTKTDETVPSTIEQISNNNEDKPVEQEPTEETKVEPKTDKSDDPNSTTNEVTDKPVEKEPTKETKVEPKTDSSDTPIQTSNEAIDKPVEQEPTEESKAEPKKDEADSLNSTSNEVTDKPVEQEPTEESKVEPKTDSSDTPTQTSNEAIDKPVEQESIEEPKIDTSDSPTQTSNEAIDKPVEQESIEEPKVEPKKDEADKPNSTTNEVTDKPVEQEPTEEPKAEPKVDASDTPTQTSDEAIDKPVEQESVEETKVEPKTNEFDDSNSTTNEVKGKTVEQDLNNIENHNDQKQIDTKESTTKEDHKEKGDSGIFSFFKKLIKKD